MSPKIIKWDGKPISTKGAFTGIPMLAYHGQLTVGPSISSSGLRTIFTQSPAHYFDTSYLNPERADEDDKEAFILGRAAHHLLLGEDDFSTLFVMRPDELDGAPWHGNRKVCKTWLHDQALAGRTVLTPAQIESIRGMARALAKHDLIQQGILNGQIETSLVWKDKETGIWLKSRPDAIPSDSGDVADLKTSVNYGFDLDNSAAKLRYDIQAALTKWGLRECLGIEMQSFSLVFALKKRPYCVDVLTFHNEDIEQAEKDLRVALRVFARCVETNNWFGPSGSQNDARYLAFSQRVRESAEHRRDFLTREIARPTVQPTELEYAETP